MTYRSTPSFAVGGVSWLPAEGQRAFVGDPTPTGWRCFHCNEHFTDARAAWRHFGNPAEMPGQHPPTECQTHLLAIRGISDDFMTSETHHPGYVLIPTAKFEQLQAAERVIGA